MIEPGKVKLLTSPILGQLLLHVPQDSLDDFNGSLNQAWVLGFLTYNLQRLSDQSNQLLILLNDIHVGFKNL
jgi:hypothetical protein